MRGAGQRIYVDCGSNPVCLLLSFVFVQPLKSASYGAQVDTKSYGRLIVKLVIERGIRLKLYVTRIDIF